MNSLLIDFFFNSSNQIRSSIRIGFIAGLEILEQPGIKIILKAWKSLEFTINIWPGTIFWGRPMAFSKMGIYSQSCHIFNDIKPNEIMITKYFDCFNAITNHVFIIFAKCYYCLHLLLIGGGKLLDPRPVDPWIPDQWKPWNPRQIPLDPRHSSPLNPWNPQTNRPLDPRPIYPWNSIPVNPWDPKTNRPMGAQTNRPLDPQTNVPRDPRQMDSWTLEPMDPWNSYKETPGPPYQWTPGTPEQ